MFLLDFFYIVSKQKKSNLQFFLEIVVRMLITRCFHFTTALPIVSLLQ
jgi:hypothetical protein